MKHHVKRQVLFGWLFVGVAILSSCGGGGGNNGGGNNGGGGGNVSPLAITTASLPDGYTGLA